MAKPKIVINPTLSPRLDRPKSQAPVLRAYYRPFFFLAVPAGLLTVLFAFFFYRFLPPVVPLFGSMTNVSERLAPKQMIFLLPTLATVINFVHALVIYFGRKYDTLLLQIFDYFTVFVQILILAVLLRTILVVI